MVTQATLFHYNGVRSFALLNIGDTTVPKKKFDVISEISDIQQIAVGDSVRERRRLNRLYASGRVVRWRKLKGIA